MVFVRYSASGPTKLTLCCFRRRIATIHLFLPKILKIAVLVVHDNALHLIYFRPSQITFAVFQTF